MGLTIKPKSPYWWIIIKRKGKKYERSTKTADKKTAQLIHDDFLKKIEAGGDADIAPIIKKHLSMKKRTNLSKSLSQGLKEKELSAPVVRLSYRQEKFKIRKKLIKMLLQTIKKDITALTLPGTEWIYERDLLLTNKCKRIVGLEYIKDRYYYAIGNVPDDPRVEFLNLSDAAFAKKVPIKEQFNHIWLDYMGMFTPAAVNSWKQMLKNKIVADKCLLAVTFESKRERKIKELYKGFLHLKNNNNFNDVRKVAIPHIYVSAAASYGYKGTILSTEIYKEPPDNTGGRVSPMIFIAIKLEKTNIDLRKKAIKMLKAGKTVEEVCRKTGYSPNQVRAFKAHITMKTY